MKNNNHKEILITCRRTAQSCMKHLRQKAIQVINYLLPSLPLGIDDIMKNLMRGVRWSFNSLGLTLKLLYA